MATATLETRINDLIHRDRRYAADAYHFVFDSLDYAAQHPCPHQSRDGGSRMDCTRHIGVHELLCGIRELALSEFGPLARCVFESWGVFGTEDFGEVVFNLIQHDLLNQSDDDRIEDFQNGYSFREAFEERYRPVLRFETAVDE